MMQAQSIPNRTGSGCVYFRADHELVGKVIAEKLRLRDALRGEGDSFRYKHGEMGR